MINRICALLYGCAFGCALFAILNTAAQCRAAGGTTVRGLIWLECIR